MIYNCLCERDYSKLTLVASVDPSTDSMRKLKPTKVPVMKEDQPYRDWRKKLEIWQAINTVLCVAPRIQAGALFESLQGIPQQLVLSELSVAEITADDGITNIVNTLDVFFMGNETQHAFNAIDELMTYKRDADLSIQSFIVEFQLKNNKVKSSGINLPDDVLGYILLKCANLPDHKQDIVKATCNDFSYQTVKAQLQKMEFKRNDDNKKLKFLPDQPIRPCTYCKCVYHYFVDCPYKPSQVKINSTPKGTWNNANSNKPKDNFSYKSHIGILTDLDCQQLSLLVGETLGYALVDTYCPHTVSGRTWFNTYINSLSRRDRQNIVTRSSNKKFCFEDGVIYQSLYCATIPIYIGHVRYNLNVDIVSNNVPLILSAKTLKRAKAKINSKTAEIRFLGIILPMLKTSTGHLCVPLCRPLDIKNAESRNVISKVLRSPPNKGVEPDLWHKEI